MDTFKSGSKNTDIRRNCCSLPPFIRTLWRIHRECWTSVSSVQTKRSNCCWAHRWKSITQLYLREKEEELFNEKRYTRWHDFHAIRFIAATSNQPTGISTAFQYFYIHQDLITTKRQWRQFEWWKLFFLSRFFLTIWTKGVVSHELFFVFLSFLSRLWRELSSIRIRALLDVEPNRKTRWRL